MVCLASQFTRELANLELFSSMNISDDGKINTRMSQIKSEPMIKASKLSLFRGGLPNAQILMQAPELPSSKSLLADALGNMELVKPPKLVK